MSLLYPWALALAALAAVPLLLHLLRRDVARRVVFPALRYLEAAEREHARSLRLRDLLLMAVRVALLGAAALAAAGPLVGRGGPEDHHPSDVAIVIDNTASTSRPADGGTTLEVLGERARATLAAAGPEDRFWILPAAGAPVAEGLAAPEALAALQRIPATEAGADLTARVAEAALLLPSVGGRAREVQLLTDGQASGFVGPRAAETRVPVVVGRYGPAPETNGAVIAVELSAGPVAPAGVALRLAATVERFALEDQEEGSQGDAALRLELGDRTAGLASAGWGSTAVLPLPALPPGWHVGRAEIEPSGLRSDDARWFTVRILPPPTVEREGPSGGFLAEAIATLESAGRVGGGPRRIRVVEGTGEGGAAGAADAVLLVPPADPLELPRFNRRLAAEGLPWSLATESARGELRLASGAGVPGLEEVRVSQRYRLATAAVAGSVDTLLRTADGEPWLVRTGGRPALLLLSPLRPRATTLPVSAGMIPFLEAALLRWSHPEPTAGGDVEAGEIVRLPPRADSLLLPDGTARRVEGGAPFPALRGGPYRVFAAGEETLLFAANVPPVESDLRVATAEEIRASLPGASVHLAGDGPQGWRAAIFGTRRGADAAPWLVALALFLVLAEAVAAAPGRGGRVVEASGGEGPPRSVGGAARAPSA